MFHATIKFAPANIAAFKKALRQRYDTLRSGHADEALAAALGFKSHAAMLHILNQISGSTRMLVQLDACLLLVRLEELGYHEIDLNVVRRMAWEIPYPDPWQDNEIEGTLRGRFRPVAANTQ
ncbi:hypothetical protein GCM10010520_62290 [Rhizobium viscosum]|uniref:Uncharacterized protein n=1 Tax=Rhizobium viscosum TaxID=1673 RepID=A0ABR9J200_RHIVS|nr:hypothetical protein [Rhizobium viscosum]MBE1509318.1 hypothetical protein [Rhizobium viscosum]